MILEVENLDKIYKSNGDSYHILKDINLKIKEGELTILKGVSGSGKSTLLSIISGMEKPTSGKVELLGEPIAKLPDIHISHFRASKIGMVFQHFNLIENISAIDNVMLPLVPLKIGLKEGREMALEALKLVNIEHLGKRDIKYLSGGEKQRVAIARAIVVKPKVLLCDEPTANLDLVNSKKFIELIERLNGNGLTALIATHDPIFDTLSIKNKVVTISQGKIEKEELKNG